MKTLYCIIASLILSVSLFGQAPPVLRQALTTNTAPVNPTNPGQIPVWQGTFWSFGTNLPGLVVTGLVSGDLLWTNNNGNLQPTSNGVTVSVPRTLTISNATLWGVTSNRIGLFDSARFIGKNPVGQVTIVGHNALLSEAVTGDHTAIGYQALTALTNGGSLVAVGDDAMGALLKGINNTAVGSQALFAEQFGTNNTAVGFQALASLVVSNNNTAVGSRSLLNNRAEDNTGVGFNAGELLVTGRKNSFLGARATVFFDDCASNVVAGVDSFASFQSVILGNDITPGDPSTQLTLVGNSTRAGSHNNSFAIGYRARVTADNQGILGSNVTQYVMRNVAYNFPSAQATDISFLRNDGAGTLDWSTNANNIGVTNLSVYNNVIFSGSIVSNFNRDILWTNDTAVTKGSPTGLSPRFALRWGSLGTDYADAWNTTNVGFWSVAMGSNIIARAPGSVVFGVDNEVRTNAINSVISGGRLSFIGTNSFNSVIAGGYSNIVNGLGTSNSVISGGIQNLIQNVNGAALGFGVVGGGFDNRASTNYAGIFSGQSQRVNGSHSAVLGGAGNTIDILVAYGGIVGGQNNTLNGAHGFIGGGRANGIGSSSATAANFGFVGGGLENTIGPIGSGNVTNAVIVGGRSHIIGEQADNAVIVGGEDHEIRQATNAFIGGGGGNTIIGTSGKARYSIIPGGGNNTMSGFTDFSFILGSSNLLATNWTGIIGFRATNNTTPYAITIAPQGETSKTIYTSSNLTVRTSFATVPDTVVTLAADNQVVDATLRTHIRLASDSAVAGDRTFLLTGTNVTSGAHAILEWTGTNAGELVDDSANSGAGNIRLSATWTPTQYDTLSLIFNGTDWVETARATN